MNSTPQDNNFDHLDDREARITAYALGELNEADRAELERELEANAELRAELDAIRATVGRLEAALAAESAPGLTDDQHAQLNQATGESAESPGRADDDRGPVIFTFSRIVAGTGVLAAACLLIVFAVVPMLGGNLGKARDQARVDERAEGMDAAAGLPADARTSTRGGQAGRAGGGFGGGGGAGSGDAYNFGQTAPAGEMQKRGVYGVSPQSERDRGVVAGGLLEGRVETETADELQRAVSSPPPTPRADAPPPAPGSAMPGRRGGGIFSDPEDDPARPDIVDEADSTLHFADEDAEAESDDMRLRASRMQRELAREAYARLVDNPFYSPTEPGRALSTFSIDVDTASYSNVRRMLRDGIRPPADAVRIEEFINAFDYSYEPPSGEHPFSVNVDMARAPWAPDHELVRIGLKGREVDVDMRPATSLVFLLDVSGSMNSRNKLPLVKQSIRMLVDRLNADDRVAIVVYAGASGLVLPSTYLNDKDTVLDAVERLHAGGSTNGGAGIELAYKVAEDNFIEDGVNRVILCTDGDFNVGVSSEGELVRLIEKKRESGVELSVLGFGAGNWQDARMEQLSNAGNGNFAYIDSMDEAQRVLVDNLAGTLVTIAKDVKIQVDFNPANVQAYRLIGYANRILANEDFNDDTKDAGEIGAGHTVTALYEIVPPGVEFAGLEHRSVDESKYRKTDDEAEADAADDAFSNEILTVKLRYKEPGGDVSTLIEQPLRDPGPQLGEPSADFNLAASLAGFGMLLRESPYRGDANWPLVRELVVSAVREDPSGRRAELLTLIDSASRIVGPIEPPAPVAAPAAESEDDADAAEAEHSAEKDIEASPKDTDPTTGAGPSRPEKK